MGISNKAAQRAANAHFKEQTPLPKKDRCTWRVHTFYVKVRDLPWVVPKTQD